jgi:hypothetical protein
MNTTGRHEVPEDATELAKLAYLLRASSGEALVKRCDESIQRNRETFDRLFRDAEGR